VEPKQSPVASGGNQSPVRSASKNVDSCKYDIIITEIVTFDNEIVYIEVWSKDSCVYGNQILTDLFVKVNDSNTAISSINLKDKRFDDNGFIVICSTNMLLLDNDSCDISYNIEPIVGPIGSSSVRLYKPNDIIDIFGGQNADCDQASTSVICFLNQGLGLERVARKREIDVSTDTFSDGEWIFYSDGTSMTPGTREDSPPRSNGDLCEYSIIIKEIVTFNDKVIFIEVQATDRCAYGRSIRYDLFLEIVDTNTRINLRGNSFDSDGFVVICTTRNFLLNKMISSNDSCGLFYDFGPIRNSSVRLYKSTGTVDVFGYPNGSCDPANMINICFSSPGRVARNPAIDQPNVVFDNKEWIFYNDGSMTPGTDVEDRVKTNQRAPTSSPAVNGGSYGKGGKGGKGKRGYR